MKRSLLAVLAIFVAWSAMDVLLHGVFLTSSYAATAALWRPMPEMKTGLISFTVLVSAFVFVSAGTEATVDGDVYLAK